MTKKRQKYTKGMDSSSLSGAGNWTAAPNKEIRTLSNTVHRNQPEMDHRPKGKARHYNTFRGKHRPKPMIYVKNIF